MVQGVVELHAEGQNGVLPQASDLVFLPSEKSVLNCPGPFMMLWPAVPYAVEPSDPTRPERRWPPC